MTYQPKPGDRVTSPLLVGEWVVFGNTGPDEARLTVMGDACTVVYRLGQRGMIAVPTADLSPVAPPPPPEPPVGSVVWARGQLWLRTDENGPWHWATAKNLETWEFLAAASDLSPVVAVSQVADWLGAYWNDTAATECRQRFGWPDE